MSKVTTKKKYCPICKEETIQTLNERLGTWICHHSCAKDVKKNRQIIV